jgi:hypothetical protein
MEHQQHCQQQTAMQNQQYLNSKSNTSNDSSQYDCNHSIGSSILINESNTNSNSKTRMPEPLNSAELTASAAATATAIESEKCTDNKDDSRHLRRRVHASCRI